MKCVFWYIGKSTPAYIEAGIEAYEKRIKHYVNYETICFPQVKHAAKLPPNELKKKEAEMVLQKLGANDQLVLLDEHGKAYRSIEFAKYLEQQFNYHSGRLVFLIGGAYGFDEKLYSRAKYKISLGKGTYSHQLIRVMFLEQLYRALTIIKGEKYHNE